MEDELPKGARNLTGQRFGSLIPQYIVKIIPNEGALWFCLCVCGSDHTVLATDLLRGRTHYCLQCARAHRQEQLRDARSNILRFDGVTRKTLARPGGDLPPEARAVFEDMIERRRRAGVPITPQLVASCREVALIEACQIKRQAA